jgi:hypothetical protein
MRLYIALGLLATTAVSLNSALSDEGFGPDTTGSGAYSRVLYYQDACNDRITDAQAQDVDSLVSQGVIDVQAFLEAYYINCNFDSAITVAEGNLAGTLDAGVYNRTLHYRNECGSGLSDVEAQSISRLCSQGAIDLNAFLDAYDNTCKFASGIAVGLGEANGSIPVVWYIRVLNYKSICNTVVTDSQAQQIATLVSRNQVDLGDFFSYYYRSCNFNAAVAHSPIHTFN